MCLKLTLDFLLIFAGFGATALGLKKRKATKPIPFVNLPLVSKQKIIIGWFTSAKIAENSIKSGKVIDEDAIEVIPDKILDSCLDDSVDLSVAKPFFTEDGWKLLEQIVKVKKETVVWKCNSCQLECADSPTVLCNSCLFWHHYSCVGLIQKPRTKFWFCRECASA